MLSDTTANADDIGTAMPQIVLAITNEMKPDSPSQISNLCNLVSQKCDLAMPETKATVDTSDN